MTTKRNLINTNKPRDSIVMGDDVTNVVVKIPNTTKPAYINNWLAKQRHARTAVNFIYSNQHRLGGYFIPKITEVSNSANKPYVHEQRAAGRALTKEFFNSLPLDTQEQIYQKLANFVYDMNHCRPILTLQQRLTGQNENGMDFNDVIEKIKPYLDSDELAQIQNACKFFESHPEMTSSLVFFHGDMNENNIFYDIATDTLSILDFAEATYETLEYVFDHDLIKLPWLNPDKLLTYYQDLSKQDDIVIKSHPAMIRLYDALRELRWTGESIANNDKTAHIFKNILHDAINKMNNAYGAVVMSFQQKVQTL